MNMPTATDNVASFRALYGRHRDDVWRYLRRRSDDDVAEDLTTEVFIVAWRRRPDLSDGELAWLYGVARHVLANHRRGARRAVALVDKASGFTNVYSKPITPISSMSAQTLQRRWAGCPTMTVSC